MTMLSAKIKLLKLSKYKKTVPLWRSNVSLSFSLFTFLCYSFVVNIDQYTIVTKYTVSLIFKISHTIYAQKSIMPL